MILIRTLKNSFSGIAALESAYRLYKGRPSREEDAVFNEQAMLNCMSGGCDGGNAFDVYEHASREGVYLESNTNMGSYQGMKVSDKCQKKRKGRWSPPVYLSSYCASDVRSDREIEELVYKYGPMTLVIRAGDSWRNTRGVAHFDEKGDPNHMVLIVGWQHNAWIIKNR